MVEVGRPEPHTESRPFPVPVRANGAHREANGVNPFERTGSGADSALWRAVAAEMYGALGSPKVAGYSPRSVHRMLTGAAALDPQFVAAMITHCKTSINGVQFIPDVVAVPHRGGVLRRITRRRSRSGHEPVRTAQPLRAVARSAGPAMCGGGRVTDSRDEVPFPDAITTAGEFGAGLRALKQWSCMSFRQIEQQAQQQGRWLPKSSISDMLRKDAVPKPDALEALLCALGLTPADRARWQALREMITCGGKGLSYSPEPTGDRACAAAGPRPGEAFPTQFTAWWRRLRRAPGASLSAHDIAAGRIHEPLEEDGHDR